MIHCTRNQYERGCCLNECKSLHFCHRWEMPPWAILETISFSAETTIGRSILITYFWMHFVTIFTFKHISNPDSCFDRANFRASIGFVQSTVSSRWEWQKNTALLELENRNQHLQHLLSQVSLAPQMFKLRIESTGNCSLHGLIYGRFLCACFSFRSRLTKGKGALGIRQEKMLRSISRVRKRTAKS